MPHRRQQVAVSDSQTTTYLTLKGREDKDKDSAAQLIGVGNVGLPPVAVDVDGESLVVGPDGKRVPRSSIDANGVVSPFGAMAMSKAESMRRQEGLLKKQESASKNPFKMLGSFVRSLSKQGSSQLPTTAPPAKVVFAYASQTGKGREIAQNLYAHAIKKDIKAEVCPVVQRLLGGAGAEWVEWIE